MGATIINVISGKGGTGKTLLACVLADMLGNAPDAETVVVDLDCFVRGLTSLLYFHREEKLHIAQKEETTVADFFTTKRLTLTGSIAIAKYRSFDVVPAVHRIDEKLNFQDLAPNTRTEAKAILQALLSSLADRYRFVILDSRAGYDELVAATHELSTVSICVEEQDPISQITSDNLIGQLSVDGGPPVFRLTNKARGIGRGQDIVSQPRGVADLGVIPFDMDILNNFGSPRFWDIVVHSLYRLSLAQAWNVLNSKLQLGVSLTVTRVSPVISSRVEEKFGLLASKERIVFAYALILSGTGLLYGLFGRELLYVLREDPVRAASLIMGLFGIIVAIVTVFRKPKS